MLIDTHCHLDFNCFDTDRDEVIQRAQSAGISFLINVGVNVCTSKQSIELANNYASIFAAVGIHPHYISQATDTDIQEIEFLATNQKVVAIGEIGLDYYDHKMPHNDIPDYLKVAQKNFLMKFFELAGKTGLPVILHCRQAAEDIAMMIQNNLKPPVHGVIHCFSHDRKFLNICLDSGLYISFTGKITYKKAEFLRELLEYVPLDRLLLETDTPFLAPQILRGKRNEPVNVRILAEEIARIKKIDFLKVAQTTTKNARQLFSI